jgi:hypothetical protein
VTQFAVGEGGELAQVAQATVPAAINGIGIVVD